MKALRIGLVGATGLVGDTFINLIDEMQLEIAELRPFASALSAGKILNCMDREYPVQILAEGCFANLDAVFFSSGDEISQEWAPKAIEQGAFAIDNSAVFRMNHDVHLSVPEVNSSGLPSRGHPSIIANPNCSTIQLVLALKPLQDRFGLSDVRVASYQSVSGAGREALNELIDQSIAIVEGEEMPDGEIFKYQIAFNTVPQIGSLMEDNFCSEEHKIMNETKKILDQKDLTVSAFTVRVPTINSHAEAVWVTLKKEATVAEFRDAISQQVGLRLHEEGEPSFPTMVDATGQNEVFVGRIKKDPNYPRTFQMWVVADNLRKGAALNGIQILQKIFS